MIVSIILTCYKQEKYIEETILSVINQSFKDRELLVWDDSPADICRNIISEYVKKYPDKIKAWHHNSNKWIVNNMQFLIEQRNKKSEYVAFLEWDDCLFPEYLEKKLEIFKKYQNTQLVYNELTTVNEKWKVINKKELKFCNWIFSKKWKISYNELVSNTYYMSRSTLMVRSEAIKKYDFIPTFLSDRTIISDIYFFNQVAHNEDIYGIEDPLTYYRIQENSVSKNINWWIKYFLELIEYYKYLLNNWMITKKIYRERVNKRYLLISTMSLKKSLSMWIFSTIRLFIIECFLAIKKRIRNVL